MGAIRKIIDGDDSAPAEQVAWPAGITGLELRHPGVAHFGPLFAYGHLTEGLSRETSELLAEVAAAFIADLPDGPELSTGLRKLLEAKDCFVRAPWPGGKLENLQVKHCEGGDREPEQQAADSHGGPGGGEQVSIGPQSATAV